MNKMTVEERAFLLNRLDESKARLLVLTEDLTAEQWIFRETSQRWSIQENFEHLVLFERFIRGTVLRILDAPAEPDKMHAAADMQTAVLGLATAGEMRIEAREIVRPSGAFTDTNELKETLWRERAETITFARDVEADMRQHFFAHLTLGDLDAYQWLLVIAQHSDRHAAQIEKIMLDPQFPR